MEQRQKQSVVLFDDLCQEKLPSTIVDAFNDANGSSQFHTAVTISFRRGVTVDIYEQISVKKVVAGLAASGSVLIGFAEVIYRFYPLVRSLFVH